MKRITTILVILLIPFLFIDAEFYSVKKDKVITKNINAKEIKTLNVVNEFGNVNIESSSTESVNIIATITTHARKESDAIDLLNNISIQISENSGEILVQSKLNKPHIRNISFNIDLEISIPKRLGVNVQNKFGDISIKDIIGKVYLENSNGLIECSNLNQSIITNKFGDIRATKNNGMLNINNSNGKITVAGCNGATTINSRFSDIDIKKISNDLIITSKNGSITIYDAQTTSLENTFGNVFIENQNGLLDLKVFNGDIEVNNSKGDAILTSSFGNVSVKNVMGKLKIDGKNSDVTVYDIDQDSFIENSFGKIDIKNISGNLNVQNINGDIQAEAIKGNLDISNQFGLINCNNITGYVNASNNNGSIILKNVMGIISTKNSFGDILLNNIPPDILCYNSNGNISILNMQDGIPKIKARTSFADINLTLNSQTSAKIHLETSFGSIDTGNIKGNSYSNFSNEEFEGIMNDGKGVINCSGSNSDIKINIK